MTIGRFVRLDRLAGLVDEELHAIELLQQVVGELDVGLVDLVDQQHRAHVHGERFPQLAALDVVLDVVDARIAELAVAQARDGVVLVKALVGLGRRFDMPLDDGDAERLGHLQRQRRLAGAGLALDEQGAGEGDRRVDGNLEVVRRHVAPGSIEFHRRGGSLSAQRGLARH